MLFAKVEVSDQGSPCPEYQLIAAATRRVLARDLVENTTPSHDLDDSLLAALRSAGSMAITYTSDGYNLVRFIA